jgi:nucleoside diphosphate kinase
MLRPLGWQILFTPLHSMADQLSYVFITPAALRKGRAGGILGRLISRSGLELHTGRIFAPSAKTLGELASTLSGQAKTATYLKGLSAGSQSLVLVLKGEDAAAKVASIVGNDDSMNGRGETLRDTFGDLVESAEEGGKTVYFEPGVIAPASAAEAAAGLKLLASASDSEGGILDAASTFSGSTEKTLVLIKPDNFAFPNTRPGGVIDLFARTGLALVGFKPFHLSVAQGEEFYGPVLDFLVEKLPDGRAQWESIIAFMSGKRPSECTPEEKTLPGTQPCVALIYQGPDAVAKIREALGSTNPANAAHGTIRKEFGSTIMINGAHASDSVENVARETGIIRLEENDFKTKIAATL